MTKELSSRTALSLGVDGEESSYVNVIDLSGPSPTQPPIDPFMHWSLLQLLV